MPQSIPMSYQALFKGKSIAYLATVMGDGTPQVTPVWVDFDGQYILVNTAIGRLKDHNMTQRPQVGIVIQDPDDAYRYVAVQGRVVGVREESDGAREHINQLSWRYRGKDFVFPPGQIRRIYKISPEKVLVGD
jgi:PPOX class probable F420-dependent enzyme